jgi:hypothetical protein
MDPMSTCDSIGKEVCDPQAQIMYTCFIFLNDGC